MMTVVVAVTARGGDQTARGADEAAYTSRGANEAAYTARGANKSACTSHGANKAALTAHSADKYACAAHCADEAGWTEAARTQSSGGGRIPSLPPLPMMTVTHGRGAGSDSESETLTVEDSYIQEDEYIVSNNPTTQGLYGQSPASEQDI
jgi:hypothetical protein